MILNDRAYLLLLFIMLSFGLAAQPMVRQVKISEGDSTHFLLYGYDANGKVTYERRQIEADRKLVNVEQTEWLSLGDTLQLQRKSVWKEGKWQAVHLISTRYHGGKLVVENHSTITNQIENVYKSKLLSLTAAGDEYHYFQLKNNQLQRTKMVSLLRAGNGSFSEVQFFYEADTLFSKLTTTQLKDSIGRTDSILTEYHVFSDNTTERTLTRLFYHNNDTLVHTQLTRTWNQPAAVWENDSKIEYFYTPEGSIALEVYANFREMRWIPAHRYVYSYNPEGVLSEKILYASIYRQWRKLSTINYSDLMEGFPRMVQSTYNFWGGTTGKAVSTDLEFYFNGSIVVRRAHTVQIEYLIHSAVDPAESNSDQKLVVFPNPSNGILFMGEPTSLIRSWELYDLQGRRILSTVANYPVNNIDISTVPAGMYLLRLIDSSNQLHQQKITKY